MSKPFYFVGTSDDGFMEGFRTQSVEVVEEQIASLTDAGHDAEEILVYKLISVEFEVTVSETIAKLKE